MKTLKKLSALLLALMMSLTLFACDNKKSDDDNADGGKSSSVSTPEDALKAYFKAVEKTDTEAYISIMSEENKCIYEDNADTSLEDEVEEMLKEWIGYLEEDYGRNAKFEIKVVETEDMSNKKLKSIKSVYAGNEDLDGIEIGEGAEIDFDITIKGSDYSNEGDGTAYVIQEDGNWKVYDIDIDI